MGQPSPKVMRWSEWWFGHGGPNRVLYKFVLYYYCKIPHPCNHTNLLAYIYYTSSFVYKPLFVSWGLIYRSVTWLSKFQNEWPWSGEFQMDEFLMDTFRLSAFYHLLLWLEISRHQASLLPSYQFITWQPSCQFATRQPSCPLATWQSS